MRFSTITEEHPPFEFRSPHGVRKMECQSRYWNGIAVRHVVQYLGPGRVWHDLSSKDPTAAILLEQVGGFCDSRLNVNRPTPRTRFDERLWILRRNRIDSGPSIEFQRECSCFDPRR